MNRLWYSYTMEENLAIEKKENPVVLKQEYILGDFDKKKSVDLEDIRIK